MTSEQFAPSKNQGTGARTGSLSDTVRQFVLESAEEKEAMLASILETIPEAIITIDEKGIINSYSAASERIFGYQPEEAIGQNIKFLAPEPYRDKHDGFLSAYRKTGHKKVVGTRREVTGLRKDGSKVPLDLSVNEMFFGGRRFFTGILRDMTVEKKRQEDLNHTYRMEAMGQLTGGIAHDFNNLLTVILGNLELLESRIDNEVQLSLVEEAKEAVELGADLTGHLLAFGRRQSLNPTVIDLNQLLLDATVIMRRTLGERTKITTALEPDLWPILADPGQIENAVINLALNARDAMPAGGSLTISTAKIEVDEEYCTLHPEAAPGDYVKLTISDTGMGMTADVLAHAFEPFFTTKDVGEGSGLGLSIVYGFAKQSGGFLQLESEHNQGTTVGLYLPKAVRDTAPNRKEESSSLPRAHGTEVILVVEDDRRVRRVTVSRLEELGYRVIETESGLGALEYIDNGTLIDLLFTDVVMPGGMSGAELADLSRCKRPDLKVLFTSGYAEEALTLNEGETLLPKPYNKAILAAKLREVLDGTSPT